MQTFLLQTFLLIPRLQNFIQDEPVYEMCVDIFLMHTR